MIPAGLRNSELVGRTIAMLGVLGSLGIAVIRYTGLQEYGFRMMGIAGASLAFTLGATAISLVGVAVVLLARPTRRDLRWLLPVLVPILLLAEMSAPFVAGRIAPERATDGPALSVLAQNLWFQNEDPQRTLDAVLDSGADVLVLTEFTPDFDRLLDDGPRSAATRSAYPHQWRAAESLGGGLAVLSAVPIEGVVPIPLSARAVAVTLDVAGEEVEVWAMHPVAPSDRWGLKQWQHDYRVLLADVADAGPRTVLAGDFNATRGHRAFRRLLRAGELRDVQDAAGGPAIATWPSGMGFPPLMRLDHVLVGSGIGIAGVTILPDIGSDHRGVLAELRVTPP